PTISYMDDNGMSRTLSQSYGDATVIAFVDQPSSTPSSEVIRMSDALAADVTVVEICLSGKDKSAKGHEGLVKNQIIQGRNIISLSDHKGLIPTKFNNAKPNAVFLLDKNGIIRKQGELSELNKIKNNIRNMVEEAERENEALYSGG
ncbi:MAG: hypothetical protein ABIK28_25105, partial [Planctomycetota bacterium]